MTNGVEKYIKFVDNRDQLDPGSFIVEIEGRKVKNEGDLYEVLDSQMKFPYFGGNWDALSDIMGDFFYLNNKNVILFHDTTMEEFSDEDFKTYIEILISDAYLHDVKSNEDNKSSLRIVFPTKLRSRFLKRFGDFYQPIDEKCE